MRVVRLCCRRRRLLLLCSLGLLGEALEAHPDSYLNTLLFAINRSLFSLPLSSPPPPRRPPHLSHWHTQKKKRERERLSPFPRRITPPRPTRHLFRHHFAAAQTERQAGVHHFRASLSLSSPGCGCEGPSLPRCLECRKRREKSSAFINTGEMRFPVCQKGGKGKGERLLDVTPRSVLRSLGRLLLLPLRMCGNE